MSYAAGGRFLRQPATRIMSGKFSRCNLPTCPSSYRQSLSGHQPTCPKALGIEVPPMLLPRAYEAIELIGGRMTCNRASHSHRSPSAHLRGHGCRDLLVYCELIQCNHSVTMNAESLPDEIVIRSLCRRMVCTRCGLFGADVRPDWRPHTNKVRPSIAAVWSLATAAIARKQGDLLASSIRHLTPRLRFGGGTVGWRRECHRAECNRQRSQNCREPHFRSLVGWPQHRGIANLKSGQTRGL